MGQALEHLQVQRYLLSNNKHRQRLPSQEVLTRHRGIFAAGLAE
jgi:hypothetical protein